MNANLKTEDQSVYAGATGTNNAALSSHSTTDRLGTGYAQMKDTIAQASQQLADRARDTARRTGEYAHREPWKLVGLAAALGVVVGMLISQRR